MHHAYKKASTFHQHVLATHTAINCRYAVPWACWTAWSALWSSAALPMGGNDRWWSWAAYRSPALCSGVCVCVCVCVHARVRVCVANADHQRNVLARGKGTGRGRLCAIVGSEGHQRTVLACAANTDCVEQIQGTTRRVALPLCTCSGVYIKYRSPAQCSLCVAHISLALYTCNRCTFLCTRDAPHLVLVLQKGERALDATSFPARSRINGKEVPRKESMCPKPPSSLHDHVSPERRHALLGAGGGPQPCHDDAPVQEHRSGEQGGSAAAHPGLCVLVVGVGGWIGIVSACMLFECWNAHAMTVQVCTAGLECVWRACVSRIPGQHEHWEGMSARFKERHLEERHGG
eukprot:scaffold70963_cov20-Tisochrysis_lutea.AAC.3